MKQYLEIDVSMLSDGAKKKLMDNYRNIHVYEMELMGVYEHYIIIEVDTSTHGHNFNHVHIIKEVKLSDKPFADKARTVLEAFQKKYPDFQE